jgi:hypothetical protein
MMSVSSLTNVAVARRTDDLGKDAGGKPRTAAEAAQATADLPATQSPSTAALMAIATYIPTEIITLYVAALAALAASDPSIPAEPSVAASTGGSIASSTDLIAFWTILALTPVIVWLVYAAKVRNAGKKLPKSPSAWPWWEMASSTVAFAAWAYAMPNSVFTRFTWYTAALGTLLVLIVSTLLGLIAPIVQRKLPAG